MKPQVSDYNGAESVLLQGAVRFDFEADSPEAGKLKAKGEFVRIKPKFERKDLTPEEREFLFSKITQWVETYFDISKDPDYFENIINISISMGSYIDPWAELQSKELQLGIKSLAFDWLMDDLLENAIELNLPCDETDQATTDLLAIWTHGEKCNIFTSQSEYFNPLYPALHSLRNMFMGVIPPNDFEKNIQLIGYYMKRFHYGCKFYEKCPTEDMCSEAMFGYWRQITNYYDKTAVFVAAVHGILPSQETLGIPVFVRILDILSSSSSLMNDVVGLKKDIEQNAPNLILFKTNVCTIPFEVAVKQVCIRIEDELKEYIKLRQIILDSYVDDLKIEKFINLLDTVVDGQNRIYVGSKRYGTGEALKLIR